MIIYYLLVLCVLIGTKGVASDTKKICSGARRGIKWFTELSDKGKTLKLTECLNKELNIFGGNNDKYMLLDSQSQKDAFLLGHA